jgi:hypothetical protein
MMPLNKVTPMRIFSVGQEVEYTAGHRTGEKTWKGSRGTVVNIDGDDGHPHVNWHSGPLVEWLVSKGMILRTMSHHPNNLGPTEYTYDPNQQGDTDDDL